MNKTIKLTSFFKHVLTLTVSLPIVMMSASHAQTITDYSFDMETDSWSHGSAAPVVGWGGLTNTELSGSTTVNATDSAGNLVPLTIDVTYGTAGTATPNSNNGSYVDAIFNKGVIIGSNGSNDLNQGGNLENYTYVDFTYSQAVPSTLSFGDIDSFTPWEDAIYVEAWNGPAGAAGSGTSADSLSLGSFLNQDIQSGASAQYANIPYIIEPTVNGNYLNLPNSRASLTWDGLFDTYRIYHFNNVDPTSANGAGHGINFLGGGYESTVVPEPTTPFLLFSAAIMTLARRKR